MTNQSCDYFVKKKEIADISVCSECSIPKEIGKLTLGVCSDCIEFKKEKVAYEKRRKYSDNKKLWNLDMFEEACINGSSENAEKMYKEMTPKQIADGKDPSLSMDDLFDIMKSYYRRRS